MFRAGSVCRDVRQVHFCLLAGRQLDFRFLGSFFQTLHRQRIALQVDAVVFLELARQIIDQTQIEVLTTEEGVTVGGQYFKLVLAIDFGNFDDGNIEGTATQVVNRDSAIAFQVVHTVGQRRSGWLVNDAFYIQTGNATRVFGGLALGIVEVSRHGDYRFGHFFAEVIFGGFLHLFQNIGRHLRRRHFLAAGFNPGVTVVGLDDFVRHHLDVFLYDIVFKTATDQALDRIQGVVGVGYRLTLGTLTHQHLTVFGIGNDGRRGTRAFGVFDDFDLVTIADGNTGVGGTEVNTNDFTHV